MDCVVWLCILGLLVVISGCLILLYWYIGLLFSLFGAFVGVGWLAVDWWVWVCAIVLVFDLLLRCLY